MFQCIFEGLYFGCPNEAVDKHNHVNLRTLHMVIWSMSQENGVRVPQQQVICLEVIPVIPFRQCYMMLHGHSSKRLCQFKCPHSEHAVPYLFRWLRFLDGHGWQGIKPCWLVIKCNKFMLGWSMAIFIQMLGDKL